MKNLYIKQLVLLFSLSFVLFTTASQAKNYYVSATGSDTNNGLTQAAAWKSITKVNSSFSSFVAGDSILFQSGDTFYGSIIVNKSGTSSKPIVISSYGTGAKPVITGFTTATGWTNAGTNLWQSAPMTGTNSGISMVVINGVARAMGRYPNSGYKTFTGSTATTSITDPTLTATPNWKGATVCIRKLADIISRDSITGHSGGTITYSDNLSGYNSINGYGYFVQNSVLALDIQNEWCFNTSGRKVTVYSTAMPASVKVATKDTLLYFVGFDYITVDGLAFEGGDKAAICIGGPMTGQVINPVIKNCDINFSGRDAIYASNNAGLLVNNCRINTSLNNAILLESEGGRSLDATITNNVIKNTGTIPGLGYWNSAKGYHTSLNGITNTSSPLPLVSQTYTVQYNQIDTTGHVGIAFYCNDAKIKNNLVNYHNYITDDGGGINTFDVTFGGTVEVGREITGNIILNGPGAGVGTVTGENVALGIYIDDKSDGILVEGNSVENHARSAFYIHNGTNIIVRNNTFYNSSESQSLLVHDNHAVGMPIRNVSFKKNILFSKKSTQLVSMFRTILNDVGSMFSSNDSNFYARPVLTTGAIINTLTYYTATNLKTNYTLQAWKTPYPNYDVNTKFSGQTVSTTDDLRFEYNAGKSAKTVTLAANYIDIHGTPYNGSVTLQPYTSVILMKSGELTVNKAPVANSGTDKTISLPANSISLTGGGTDTDGTISSYAWVKISGPASSTIATGNAATTAINNLVQGVYQFELAVKDNIGATGKDTVQVTVNAAPNQPPVANTGTNKIIIISVSNTTLTGSGTDADGTISSFTWTKVSGPSSCTIVTSDAATTAVNNLVPGSYKFELAVKDNNGASGKDSVQLIVNAAPVTNADTDKIISLPENTTTLTGSGTDADGTINSYAWVKISGPDSGTIATSNAATTVLNNLVQGVYQYELTVTDNNDATAKDTVQVTVNTVPSANAGTDKIMSIPVNLTVLTGSGTDTDGTISNYVWTKISGPSAGTIATVNAVSTEVNNLVQGTYQYELTVTDNNGATGKDTVQVTVNAAPSANAGTDIVITLLTNTASLTGSGTDADGTISSHAWVKISGPVSGNIATDNAATTSVNALVQGVYNFQLTVTDNNGATGTDTVKVTVNESVNQAPVANAGADKTIALPVSTTTLNGTGIDADGTIVSYMWNQISGPKSPKTSTPWLANTTLSSMIKGVYVYKFTVTDNKGSIAIDTVKITVNAETAAKVSTQITTPSSVNTGSNEFKVFPNPVMDIANVNIGNTNGSAKMSVSVTDLSGRVVIHNGQVNVAKIKIFKLDMTSLKDGYYIITVRFDNGQMLSSKVIKFGGK